MRLALLGFTLSLAALPLTTQAQVSRLSQSTVSLLATYARAGTPTESIKDGKRTTTTRVDSVSYRNADLLEVMLAQGHLPEGQTSIQGWSLVAVWADWESEGASSYRFFARKKIEGEITTVAVPEALLRLELLDPYAKKTLTLRGGEPVSGSVLYKAFARVSLGADTYVDDTPDDAEDDERQIGAGSALGVIVGPGRYARPAGSSDGIYLPGATSFTGYGVSDDDEDVVSVRLRLGAASSVPATQYPDFNAETGDNSRDPDSSGPVTLTGAFSAGTIQNSAGGALNLGSPTTYTGLTRGGSGTLTLNGGSTSYLGSTTVVGGTLTVSVENAPVSLSSVGFFLADTTLSGGTTTLETGTLNVDSLFQIPSSMIIGGVLNLGSSNTFFGTTTFESGTLTLNLDSSFQGSSTTIVDGVMTSSTGNAGVLTAQ